MGYRTLPTECKHGWTVDWGDFGGDDEAPPEPCPECEAGRQPATGREVGQALCRALGLDPEQVRSIMLSVEADDIASVIVERLVSNDEADDIAGVLVEYRLVEKDD